MDYFDQYCDSCGENEAVWSTPEGNYCDTCYKAGALIKQARPKKERVREDLKTKHKTPKRRDKYSGLTR